MTHRAVFGLDVLRLQESMAHLNIKINTIELSSEAHGVMGQTAHVKLTDDGLPVLTGQGKNGHGLIDGTHEDYKLTSLFSTDFSFSSFEQS